MRTRSEKPPHSLVCLIKIQSALLPIRQCATGPNDEQSQHRPEHAFLLLLRKEPSAGTHTNSRTERLHFRRITRPVHSHTPPPNQNLSMTVTSPQPTPSTKP